MVIVKIIGGLGNQMFQYAYAKSLEQRGYVIKIDTSAFETYSLHQYGLEKYNIDLQASVKEENNKLYKNTLFFKVLKRLGLDFSKRVKEKSLLFDKDFLNVEDDSYLDGYFQCENYFKDIREIILKQFTINKEISIYTKDIENQIKNSQKSCSLHIRRGDFVNSTNINIHGACDMEYYKKAMKYLENKVGDMSYFIFSDDIEWVKENLATQNALYIESKEERIPHEDIYLMSLCNHNIIANSSFSWWGAWLNQNENKIVITPKRWFADNEMQKQSKDLICESWVRI